jgi:membrane-bound inhibitor of C-type lysozyme
MTWDIAFKVTDYDRISSVKILPFSTVISTTGYNGNDLDNLISVSPNPFSSETEATFSCNPGQKAVIKLNDLQGRLVSTIFNGTINSGQSNLSLPVSASGLNLKPGIYLLNWSVGEKSGVKKLVFTGK